MDIHKNARLTPLGREALAQKVLGRQGTLNSAAAEFKVSPRTAAKLACSLSGRGDGRLS